MSLYNGNNYEMQEKNKSILKTRNYEKILPLRYSLFRLLSLNNYIDMGEPFEVNHWIITKIV